MKIYRNTFAVKALSLSLSCCASLLFVVGCGASSGESSTRTQNPTQHSVLPSLESEAKAQSPSETDALAKPADGTAPAQDEANVPPQPGDGASAPAQPSDGATPPSAPIGEPTAVPPSDPSGQPATRPPVADPAPVTTLPSGGSVIAGGEVSGTWGKAGSPYNIDGDIHVAAGRTLTIQPGTIVNFRGKHRMLIEGQIQVTGTEQERVLFTAQDHAKGWLGLYMNGAGASKFDFAVFEYARKDDQNPNDRTWRRGGAIGAFKVASLEIRNSIFRNNFALERGGALEFMSCSPVLENSVLENNHTGDGGGAIRLTHANNSRVVGNLFKGNRSDTTGGALEEYDSHITVGKNTFQQNSAGRSGGAMACMDGRISLDSNVISGNAPDNSTCQ